MSYVKKNLVSGEEIVHTAKAHWFIFLPSITLGAVGICLVAVPFIYPEGYPLILVGLLVFLLSFTSFIKAILYRIFTELAVTSKRCIVKKGIIRRDTYEINLLKVESFHVDQSLVERLFNCGTIVLHGTGSGQEVIPRISSPLEFRKKAMAAMDNYRA